MFRKILLAVALFANLFAAFAPVQAEAQTATTTLTGNIVALNSTKLPSLTITSPYRIRPLQVYVDKGTLICLQSELLDFSQLRVGDTVKVTLRSSAWGRNSTPMYIAQVIEVSRETSGKPTLHKTSTCYSGN